MASVFIVIEHLDAYEASYSVVVGVFSSEWEAIKEVREQCKPKSQCKVELPLSSFHGEEVYRMRGRSSQGDVLYWIVEEWDVKP